MTPPGEEGRPAFELKPISPESVHEALEKAEHYRLLNEPSQAESICLDILAVDPEHQGALVCLLLALTDQFPHRLGAAFREAMEVARRLEGEYARAYYEGIIWERRAKARYRLGGAGSGHEAYDGLHRALERYARAIELRPAGNDEAILRWNTCVRLLEREPQIRPAPEDTFRPLLE